MDIQITTTTHEYVALINAGPPGGDRPAGPLDRGDHRNRFPCFVAGPFSLIVIVTKSALGANVRAHQTLII